TCPRWTASSRSRSRSSGAPRIFASAIRTGASAATRGSPAAWPATGSSPPPCALSSKCTAGWSRTPDLAKHFHQDANQHAERHQQKQDGAVSHQRLAEGRRWRLVFWQRRRVVLDHLLF